jgi:hypothetical protein
MIDDPRRMNLPLSRNVILAGLWHGGKAARHAKIQASWFVKHRPAAGISAHCAALPPPRLIMYRTGQIENGNSA